MYELRDHLETRVLVLLPGCEKLSWKGIGRILGGPEGWCGWGDIDEHILWQVIDESRNDVDDLCGYWVYSSTGEGQVRTLTKPSFESLFHKSVTVKVSVVRPSPFTFIANSAMARFLVRSFVGSKFAMSSSMGWTSGKRLKR